MTPPARPGRPRRWPGVLAWTLWALAMAGVAAIVWLYQLLQQAGRPDLAKLFAPAAVGLLSGATVGAVLASRRPRHPVGWLLLAMGLFMAASGVASQYAPYGLLARPGAPPAAGAAAVYYPATAMGAQAMIGFVLLLTPTGSLPSPRWRWWARITAAVPVACLLAVALAPRPPASPYQAVDNPLDLHAFRGVALVAYQVALAVTTLAIGVAAGSLVVRFRHARGIERQQLRWVALAAALVAPAAVVVPAAVALGTPVLAGGTSVASVAVLPVAIGAAILRYRLYDLDRIISRSLAYGLLTVLLGGGYGIVVLGFGQLLGRSSSLAVAAATLVVAAAFQPARRRVQEAVDRRFNRRRYDTARTIDAFAARLRQQIDLDGLTAELLGVVEQTMQPTRVSLWLRRP